MWACRLAGHVFRSALTPERSRPASRNRFASDSLLEQSGFEPLVPLPSRTGAEPYRPAFSALRGGKQERSSLRRGLGRHPLYDSTASLKRNGRDLSGSPRLRRGARRHRYMMGKTTSQSQTLQVLRLCRFRLRRLKIYFRRCCRRGEGESGSMSPYPPPTLARAGGRGKQLISLCSLGAPWSPS
jgi:hypothetical protein